MPVSDTISFFDNYFRNLEANRSPAVVLHSWQHLPEKIESDVDYLVGDMAPARLLEFLERYCHRNGWILAQAMEHEPGAFYCVCFMTTAPWDALKLDAAWDYRRKGRMLLPGDFLLCNRFVPEGKSFHTPSPKAEFAYVLAKGLAKAKGPAPVIGRLEELWNQDCDGCAGVLAEFFGMEVSSSGRNFPDKQIVSALHPGAPGFDRWRARRWGWQQFRWLLRRLRRPYGLTIATNPHIDRKRLAEILLPGFRRYREFRSGEVPNRWQRLKMIYRSGLVLLAAGPAVRMASDIVDLRAEESLDTCVAVALRHMSRRGAWL